MIEHATELPPFLPILVILGICDLESAILDSSAETKPTGTPITNEGIDTFSSIILSTSYKAVGAFPIITMPPLISLAKFLMAVSDLVLLNFLALLMTSISEILHKHFKSSFLREILDTPERTISTSVIILHLF